MRRRHTALGLPRSFLAAQALGQSRVATCERTFDATRSEQNHPGAYPNADGLMTEADFAAWVHAFNRKSPACDQNGDGSCTSADFSAWVINFKAGC